MAFDGNAFVDEMKNELISSDFSNSLYLTKVLIFSLSYFSITNSLISLLQENTKRDRINILNRFFIT